MKSALRPTRKRNGSVMVEFALSATILMLIFLGTFQFGYAFYQYNTLANAVRGAARYASMAKISNSGNGVVPTAYADKVKNTLVYGDPAGGTTPVVAGLATSNVDVSVGWDAKYVPLSVTVKLSSFEINAVVKKFTITNKPSLQMPFLGQYCPLSC
jgi:Flp pilus assembly protein TadG